jgi:hypothetical protein
VPYESRIDEVPLKTCPLFATGADGEASGEILVCLREPVFDVQPLLLPEEQVATEGFFCGFLIFLNELFVDFLGFRLGTDRSGGELIRTRALLGIVG